MNYQKKIFEEFKEFRQSPKFPVYPPYHEGLYLEEFFFNFYIKNNIKTKQIYIPIFWTNCYNDGYDRKKLQKKLDSLDSSFSYFSVMQHDDSPKESLPKKCISFSAGGLRGDIPIPLICSSIKNVRKDQTKDIYCSFVGSLTHKIRKDMIDSINLCPNKSKYIIQMKNWAPKIGQKEEKNFKDIMERSIFSLCPRGYGATSFRLYESMQCNSIPIFLYDKPWFPWQEELNWTEFCILISEPQIPMLDMILESYSDNRIKNMQNKIKEVYPKYFTLESTCDNIIRKLGTL